MPEHITNHKKKLTRNNKEVLIIRDVYKRNTCWLIMRNCILFFHKDQKLSKLRRYFLTQFVTNQYYLITTLKKRRAE